MVPLAALLSLSATCWVGSLQVTWEGCQAWLRKETALGIVLDFSLRPDDAGWPVCMWGTGLAGHAAQVRTPVLSARCAVLTRVVLGRGGFRQHHRTRLVVGMSVVGVADGAATSPVSCCHHLIHTLCVCCAAVLVVYLHVLWVCTLWAAVTYLGCCNVSGVVCLSVRVRRL